MEVLELGNLSQLISWLIHGNYMFILLTYNYHIIFHELNINLFVKVLHTLTR